MKKFSRNCLICNKSFSYNAFREGKAKYCSILCYNRSQIGRGLRQYKCRHCHNIFNDSACRNRIYCCRKCVNKGAKENFRAKFTTARKALLTRGMIKECSECGYNKVPKILGVHHKDGNRDNNDITNLQVLCPLCHSLIHKKHVCH